MNNKLVLAWRNPVNRIWTPVAILEYTEGLYHFYYTNGAKEKNFIPFGQMQEKTKVYMSEELFPIFKNRLLAKSRPEYKDYLDWLDIDFQYSNDLLELSRSRGIRATDQLQLFPIPTKEKDNLYKVSFFAHGISHIADSYVERLESLSIGDELLLLKDIQNDIDPFALVLRTKDDPVELMGYCPSFFAQDFNKLLELNGNKNVKVSIQKINKEAPLQLKLLCNFTTIWPDEFNPFDDDRFSHYKG